MSKARRKFSAKFKADIIIELLKGEKNLNSIATEHGIAPISFGIGRRSSLIMPN